jgi:hypothetical protein
VLKTIAFVVALAVAAPSGAKARPVNLDQLCQGPQLPPKKAPRFEDYPAKVVRIARPAAPQLRTTEARMNRTQLRFGARAGDRFAGHYRLARLGCGAGCTDLAVIDSRTGQVWFDDELRSVVDHAYNPFDRVTVRPDSRLMMVSGAPNEDDRRNGVAFYEWTGARFQLLKRYRYDQVCRPRK